MINECQEPLSFDNAVHGGLVKVDSQSSSGKMARPYAGADDSMDEVPGATNMAQSHSPSKIPKPELLVGDLVWSKIPGHAWWPSMVSYEPNKAVYFQSSGKGKTCFKYHVQFFGDEPQRGWVSDKNMIKFTGRDRFMDLPNSVVSKRDKIPHSKQMRAWERALEQAQKALPLNRQQRKLCYVFKYNDDLQKGTRSNKSPESTGKKKEKLPKKPVKLKPRVTRRSCLLDKSKDIMNENDFCESTGDSENLNTNVTVLPKEGQSHSASKSNDGKEDAKRSDSSPEKVTLRRRGRSAGKLSIESSFMFDAVHMYPNLKEVKKNASIMSLDKVDVIEDELCGVDEVKDVELTEEKFNVTKITAGYPRKGVGMSRKRQREPETEHIIKPPKKIKVEIVTRKPHFFEFIPKKMKNKQTQTPERKLKKGVTAKKKMKRKIDFSRKAIKTKETCASKKFSRKLKATSSRKGPNKKGVVVDKNKRKGKKENISSNSCSKQAVIEKNLTSKTFGANDSEGANIDNSDHVSDTDACIVGTESTSIEQEKQPERKRKRGRPRKASKKTQKTDLDRALVTENLLGTEAGDDDVCANDMNDTDVTRSDNGKVDDSHDGDDSDISSSVIETEHVDLTNKKDRRRIKRGTNTLESNVTEKRQLRGSKIGLSGNVSPSVESKQVVDKQFKKPTKAPSRRSTRHIAISNNNDDERVVVCKVSQLPEIDDIIEGSKTDSPGINGINGFINKGLLLEVLSNINTEIPIELEVVDREDEATTEDNGHTSGEERSSEVLTDCGESQLCNEGDSLPEVEANPRSNVANEDGNCELVLYSVNSQHAEDYMMVRPDENLPVCSIVKSSNNCQSRESCEMNWNDKKAGNVECANLGATDKSFETTTTTEGFNNQIPSIETGSEIESSPNLDVPRSFGESDSLRGLINDNQVHEYFSSNPDRSSEAPVFPTSSLNGVEDADLYLNDDDVGLPVTTGSGPCIFARDGSDSFVSSYCKEIEPSNMLNSTEPEFEKSAHLDVNGLEEFQPVFAIPSFPIPGFRQSASYYQKSLDIPSSIIATLPSTTSSIGHISSGYSPIDDALSETLTPHVNTQAVSVSHVDSYGESQAPSQLSEGLIGSADPLDNAAGALINEDHSSYEIDNQRHHKADLHHGEEMSMDGPGTKQQTNGSETFENLENETENHSTEQLQTHGMVRYNTANSELSEDKSIIPVIGMLAGLDESQSTVDSIEPSEREESAANQHLYSNTNLELAENDGMSLNAKTSPLNSNTFINIKTYIKKSPTVYDRTTCYPEPSNENCHESMTSQESNDHDKSEIPDTDSNTLSANSSMSEMQSPIEAKDGAMDSAKMADDSPQVGNSLKRQRKRKAMSDFHVGLAFDEILSNRRGATDGDKGSTRLSLTKKRRENMKRIDYEENIKSMRDGDGEEELTINENVMTDEVSKNQNGGKNEDDKKHKNKKRTVSFSDEYAASGGSEIVDNFHDGTSLEKNGGVEDVLDGNPDILSDKSDSVNTPEKKKRGRKPKVKSIKEKAPKPFEKVLEESPLKKKGHENEEETAKSADVMVKVNEGAKGKKYVGKSQKKTAVKGKLTGKVKGDNHESKPKRKYVKKKDKDKATSKDGLTEKDQEFDQGATKNDLKTKGSKSCAIEIVQPKPKRRYNKKKKTGDDVVSETGKFGGKKAGRQIDKKSEKKRKQDEAESDSGDNSNTANAVGQTTKRKKNQGKSGSEEVCSKASEEPVFVESKKNKRKKTPTEKDQKSAQIGEAKERRKVEKHLSSQDDVADDAISLGVIVDESSISEGITDPSIEGDDNFERPAFFDAKKMKRGEKLETRSNISDENASISGRENDEAGKNKKESICTICEQSEGLLACNGVCFSSFHPDCLGLSTVPEKFYCDECLTGNHSCFLCKETGTLRKCSYSACGKFYHEGCTQKMRGCKLENNKLTCSLHYCGTCTNDKENSNTSKKRLLRCVRCPTAYHASGCLVAGCMQLTNTLMVCNKHFVPHKSKPHHTHYNVSWCFVCSTGGMLVCCDTCPAAFHPGCVEDLNGVPDEGWQCDSCREGKKPLYGDLVWVKYGFWRWWPARICFPDEIPTRIQNLSHDVGEFPVMFFGSRDYCWLHAGRVFPYQEGDKGCRGSSKSGTNKIFEKAIREVEEAHKELKEMQDKQMEQKLAKQSKKPPPYKQIKVNKYISALRNVIDQSEFTHCECSPNSENSCGPGSECINRMLQIECDKTCKAQENCQNQRFQKCQQSDCVPFKTPKCGWGLKTRQDIKKGDFVIEYVGELIDEATCRKRINEYHDQGISDYYFLVIDKDNIIDAYPKGNASRFMNHCCDPNCDTQKWTVNGEIRVGLFANKDIEAESELTFNYNLDTLGNEKKACQCDSKNCSGFLGVRPKTQTAIALKEKKKDKKKKKKKKDKTKTIRHEDECFACGDGGELIMCDRLSCSKCYHLKCLTLPDMPKGKWDCPWHFCDICGKRATFYCSICPNSFCGLHHDGEVLEITEGVYVCDEHSQDEIKAEKNRLKLVSKSKEESTSTNGESQSSGNSPGKT